MGANPTQAYGVALFFIAFTLIAAGLVANLFLLLLGIVVLIAAIFVFLKCKPWEQAED